MSNQCGKSIDSKQNRTQKAEKETQVYVKKLGYDKGDIPIWCGKYGLFYKWCWDN